jgi:hypothetical protein
VKAKTVIVVGFQRSGTSVLASILETLGVSMGNDALEASRANPFGYFEDETIFYLNSEILKSANGSEYSPPSRDEILNQRGLFEDEIKRYIAARSQNASVWGWKHPATTLTLDLMIPYIQNPYVIACQRDCSAAARSLAKMVDFTSKEAETLCALYKRRLEEFKTHNPDVRVLDVAYENVVAKTEQEVRRIAEFTNMNPSDSQMMAATGKIRSRNEIFVNRLYSLFKKGVANPQDVPSYIWKRIKFFYNEARD